MRQNLNEIRNRKVDRNFDRNVWLSRRGRNKIKVENFETFSKLKTIRVHSPQVLQVKLIVSVSPLLSTLSFSDGCSMMFVKLLSCDKMRNSSCKIEFRESYQHEMSSKLDVCLLEELSKVISYEGLFKRINVVKGSFSLKVKKCEDRVLSKRFLGYWCKFHDIFKLIPLLRDKVKDFITVKDYEVMSKLDKNIK